MFKARQILALATLALLTPLGALLANDEAAAAPGLIPEPVQAVAGGAPPAGSDLIIGTGGFGGVVANDTFAVDPTSSAATSVFSGVPYWGATYDAANSRVLFTTSGGTVDGADLMAWDPVNGGVPTTVGSIAIDTGAPLRVDGLAMSNGTLYGVHQFDDAAGTAGLYEIDSNTLVATQVMALTSGAYSGIDGDPITGVIYGTNDTTTMLVELDFGGAAEIPVAAYPAGRTDIDGLAIDDQGRAYLVEDEAANIAVYDLVGGSYLNPITAPFGAADTFSGGAYVFSGAPPVPVIEVPTMSTLGLAALFLALGLGSVAVLRRRQQAL